MSFLRHSSTTISMWFSSKGRRTSAVSATRKSSCDLILRRPATFGNFDMDYSKTIGVLTAHGKHHRISEDDVRIVHDAPRLLVIEVDLGGIKLRPEAGCRRFPAKSLFNVAAPPQIPPRAGRHRPEWSSGVPDSKHYRQPGIWRNGPDRTVRRATSSSDFSAGSRRPTAAITRGSHAHFAIPLVPAIALTLWWLAVRRASSKSSAKSFSMLMSGRQEMTISLSAAVFSEASDNVVNSVFNGSAMLTKEGRAIIAEELQHFSPPSCSRSRTSYRASWKSTSRAQPPGQWPTSFRSRSGNGVRPSRP